MPDFTLVWPYAVTQGWLIVEDDILTLTLARLAAGQPALAVVAVIW
jgi:hypothetical protein